MHTSDGRRRACGNRRYFCAQTLSMRTPHRIKHPVVTLNNGEVRRRFSPPGGTGHPAGPVYRHD